MDSTDAPNVDAITTWIQSAFPDVHTTRGGNAWFFSCEPKTSWPNMATIVTTDEHDAYEGGPGPVSKLTRPGVFRLNIGVGRASFDAIAAQAPVPLDHSVLDTLMPHPVYAAQRWVCILNPTQHTFETRLKPLLNEAHALISKLNLR